MALLNKLGKGSGSGSDIPPGTEIQYTAADQLKIGDIVYTVEGDIQNPLAYSTLSNTAYVTAISPDETKLFVGGYFSGYAKYYSISGTSIIYICDIKEDGVNYFTSTVSDAVFSKDGNFLYLVGGKNGGGIYSVTDTNLTFIDTIKSNGAGAALSGTNTIKLSPSGTELVIGGIMMTGGAKIYSVNGATVTYVSDIKADAGTTALRSVYCLAFSPDGTKLAIGGSFNGNGKFYSVSGTTVTYLADLKKDAAGTALEAPVNGVCFSPQSDKLIMGGGYDCKYYAIEGSTIRFVLDVKNKQGQPFSSVTGYPKIAVFSSDGTKFILGGEGIGGIFYYAINSTSVTYLFSTPHPATVGGGNSNIYDIKLFSDGIRLLICGGLGEKVILYSVSDKTIAQLSNVKEKGGSTFSQKPFLGATFSPDKTKLILTGSNPGGTSRLYSILESDVKYLGPAGDTGTYDTYNVAFFPGDNSTFILTSGAGAHIYTIVNGIATYVRSILAAATGATLRSSYCLAFSPDGTKLIIGGYFTGGAKIYSVSGTTVTYVADIKADTGTTALNGSVYCLAFSPDGTKLVLGGRFAKYAKIYSVSGTTVTYIADIKADGATAFNNEVSTATFSPDGTKLVLGGLFAGYGKIYSVSGTTVTYVADIRDKTSSALTGAVKSAVFFNNNNKLIIGGAFTDKVNIYSVNGTTLTFLNNLSSNQKGDVFDGDVNKILLSVDNTNLVVCGEFSSRAKIYTIKNDNIEYVMLAKKYDTLSTLPSIDQTKIGIAKENIEKDSKGTIVIIAEP